MRQFLPLRDEIDAVLDEDVVDDDLAEVTAFVHDVRSAYLNNEPLPRHAALLAFTASVLDDNGDPLVTAASNAHGSAPQMAGLPNRERPTGRKSRMFETVGALIASMAAKVVLGTAVAAASVGGLHVANVVDVPGLPNQAEEQEVTTTDDPGSLSEQGDEVEGAGDGEPASAAAQGQATAEAARAKKDAAAAFVSAMQAWSTCVDEADEAELDPVEECGVRPHPRDFGVTQPPTDRAGQIGARERAPVPAAGGQGVDRDPSSQGTDTPPRPPAADNAGGDSQTRGRP